MFLPHKALQDLAPVQFICYDMRFDCCYTVLQLQAKLAELIKHNTITGALWGKSETWQLEGYRGHQGSASRTLL